jgi:SAM-dependent methyltransferase
LLNGRLQEAESNTVSTKEHWEAVYRDKAPDAVSWYRPHLEVSLDLIKRAAANLSASILDVGGGESTLVDDLAESGYQNLTVLDISPTALEATKKRLGGAAEGIRWIADDVTRMTPLGNSVDVWHDRAVFHFLMAPEERAAYVRNVLHSVRRNGSVIVSSFGPNGPDRCSRLPVTRYDSDAMQREFGPSFLLVDATEEVHYTPSGAPQEFIYCYFKVASGK